MFTNDAVRAQAKKGDVIHWVIGGWMPKNDDDSPHHGLAGAISGMHNGVVVVAGGANFPGEMPWKGGAKHYYSNGYVFSVTQRRISFTGQTFELPFKVAYAASCSTPYGILAAGGENDAGLSDKVLLISWEQEKKRISVRFLPDLPFPVANASVAVHGDLVLLAGGETTEGVSNILLCLDLRSINGQWKKLSSIPNLVSHAVMVVQSNGDYSGIYLLGGRKKNPGNISQFYSTTWYFDLPENRWIEKQPMPFTLSAGTGIIQGSRIYLFGGDRGETFNKTESLILATNGERDSVKKQEFRNKRISLQSAHPGFSKEVLMYNIKSDAWSTVGAIPFDSPVTTNVVRINKHAFIIPSGEIKAGVRTPQILVGTFEK